MIERPHLASLVDDFRRHGRQIAVVTHTGLRRSATSYEDLAVLCGRFAAELERRGIVKGDRVAIWGDNGLEWLAAFFGCLMRGVLAVPIDVAGTAEFARRVIAETGTRLVCGNAEQIAQLDSGLRFEQFAAALPAQPSFALAPIEERDPFQIVFTSGTTAEPKGIVHTHRNVLASLRPIEREMQKYLRYERIFHPLRFLHTLPLSHVFGQFMGIWIPALLAAEVHFDPRLVANGLVSGIRGPRVSVLAAVPRVLDLLRAHMLIRFPDLADRMERAENIPVWKRWWLFRDVHREFGFKFWAFVCGGATLPAEVEKFWSTLGFAVIQGYGMTETAALVSLNHPFKQARGSIGKVLPGREIQLREDGEILVRGETVATAVWEGGELRQRESEWLATGDLATKDEQGNLRYLGRKKEVIVTAAGLNIYPEDLEAALLKQSAVKACAVVETQGPAGPEPLAALVMHSGDPAAAVHTANQELAEYQRIRRWVLWPEADLPRTSSGKVIRREVARILASGPRIAATAADMKGSLAEIVHRITGETLADFPDDATLAEGLHLDSLGRVELQASLETQLGLPLDDATWAATRTVGDLRRLVQGGASAAAKVETLEADEHIYPTYPWDPLRRAVRGLFLDYVMLPFVWVLGAPRVQSQLEAEPKQRVLLVSNHVTAYDVPLILYGLPEAMRKHVAVAMGGEVLMDVRKGRGQGNWFVNLVAPIGYRLATSMFNVFPLPQRTGFRRSFEHAGRAMDAGFHILVFPEGRRTPDGRMHRFQSGAGLLWRELRAPALPVYLEGVSELKVSGERWFRSGKIAVRVGQPIPLPEGAEAPELAAILEEAVTRLGSDPSMRS